MVVGSSKLSTTIEGPPVTQHNARNPVALIRDRSALWPNMELPHDRKQTEKIILAASLAAMIAPDFVPTAMAEDMPAKQAFGGETLPVLAQRPQSIASMPRVVSPARWHCRPMAQTGR